MYHFSPPKDACIYYLWIYGFLKLCINYIKLLWWTCNTRKNPFGSNAKHPDSHPPFLFTFSLIVGPQIWFYPAGQKQVKNLVLLLLISFVASFKTACRQIFLLTSHKIYFAQIICIIYSNINFVIWKMKIKPYAAITLPNSTYFLVDNFFKNKSINFIVLIINFWTCLQFAVVLGRRNTIYMNHAAIMICITLCPHL